MGDSHPTLLRAAGPGMRNSRPNAPERWLARRLDEPLTKESSMLVLSRKKNESIIINDDITIVVVEIRGDKVRLGVEAPKEVPVHRNEVYEAIRRNQQKPDSAEPTVAEHDAPNM